MNWKISFPALYGNQDQPHFLTITYFRTLLLTTEQMFSDPQVSKCTVHLEQEFQFEVHLILNGKDPFLCILQMKMVSL